MCFDRSILLCFLCCYYVCSIFACAYTGAAVVTPCVYLQVAVKMSFQPPARDRRRSSISTTAAAASASTRPTTTNADDKLFREFKQRLRSEGHVTNVATRELLLRNFHACAQKEATRALSGEQEDRKNDATCRPVHTRRESGGGIVGLLTNVFSLASEVDASQDEQSASSTGNKLFGGARRSSTTSTMSTVTSYSQSTCTHGQSPHDNFAQSRKEFFISAAVYLRRALACIRMISHRTIILLQSRKELFISVVVSLNNFPPALTTWQVLIEQL